MALFGADSVASASLEGGTAEGMANSFLAVFAGSAPAAKARELWHWSLLYAWSQSFARAARLVRRSEADWRAIASGQRKCGMDTNPLVSRHEPRRESMASRRFAMSVKFGPREFGPKIKKEKSFASEAPWRKASIVLILSPNEP